MLGDADFDRNWKEFLTKKFGTNLPETFVINLGEIDFAIPAVMATTVDGFKILQRHNAKVGVFK